MPFAHTLPHIGHAKHWSERDKKLFVT